MVLPVRVRFAGAKDSQFQPAHTLDATENGVRLAGFKAHVNVGDIIEIQYRHERAMFRVVWVRGLENSSEKHIGTECVDPNQNIWDVEFPARPDEYEEKE
jgi:hypothetical protein